MNSLHNSDTSPALAIFRSEAMTRVDGSQPPQLAAMACIAASAIAFILGQAFERRRRRRSHAVTNDEGLKMLPQLADGKHEVGPGREWRRSARHTLFSPEACLRLNH